MYYWKGLHCPVLEAVSKLILRQSLMNLMANLA